jgi:hypothetical protein
MIGDNKEIGRSKVDQRADVKAIKKIADNTNEIRNQREQDKLVKSNSFPPPGSGIVCSETRVDNILIEGFEKLHEIVAQRLDFR